jgi:hypothetical protein
MKDEKQEVFKMCFQGSFVHCKKTTKVRVTVCTHPMQPISFHFFDPHNARQIGMLKKRLGSLCIQENQLF